jgi:hypothetical protein
MGLDRKCDAPEGLNLRSSGLKIVYLAAGNRNPGAGFGKALGNSLSYSPATTCDYRHLALK